jgi:hypothetical protein
VSPEPDPARPTPAGIYDYLLGGQHYSAADQAAAEQAVAMTPATRSEVIENRAFLRRAVRYLASRGITQYLDLGSGYPAGGAVHQTAAELITSPRVVYVDNDPRVAEISRGWLDSPDTAVIVRDVRRPADIIGDPQTRRLIDWSRPVAVLLVSILHFIRDEDGPAGIVAAFREQMAPGSYLVLSHGVVLDDPEFVGQVARNWDRAASGVVMRTRDEVAGFLAGFDLVPPGLVTTVEWGTGRPPATGACSVLAAVGTLPATPPKESG